MVLKKLENVIDPSRIVSVEGGSLEELMSCAFVEEPSTDTVYDACIWALILSALIVPFFALTEPISPNTAWQAVVPSLAMLAMAALYRFLENRSLEENCGASPEFSEIDLMLHFLMIPPWESLEFLICLRDKSKKLMWAEFFLSIVGVESLNDLPAGSPDANDGRLRSVALKFVKKVLDHLLNVARQRGFERIAFPLQKIWWADEFGVQKVFVIHKLHKYECIFKRMFKIEAYGICSKIKAYAIYPATKTGLSEGTEHEFQEPVEEATKAAEVVISRGYFHRRVKALISDRVPVAVIPESLLFELSAEPLGYAKVRIGSEIMEAPYTHVEVELEGGLRLPMLALYGRTDEIILPAEMLRHFLLESSKERKEEVLKLPAEYGGLIVARRLI